MIDQETVKKLFHYDAESGILIWRFGNGRNVKPWQEVKAKNGNGYYTAKIHGKSYLAHRLAWLYVHGSFPNKYIDHKNRAGAHIAQKNAQVSAFKGIPGAVSGGMAGGMPGLKEGLKEGVKEGVKEGTAKPTDFNAGPEALLKQFSAKEGGGVEKNVKHVELLNAKTAAELHCQTTPSPP